MKRSSSSLERRARQMRADMAPQASAVLRLLHKGELVALNWRRQACFGGYVLDFVSHPAKLVVEVDGAQHAEDRQAQHDAKRTAWLKTQGHRVLRVWNDEAVKEQDGVWLSIHDAANATLAAVRMRRWREAQGKAAIAHLPLDGGGGREAAGGGAHAGTEEGASRGIAGKTGGPHPLSHASRDSSPIEGERE